uniref:Indole-3-glycerol phosphate synthase n=1 Tax=Geoglobus ahangari TaxID=113653 RepID=A0A7C3UKX9_9EURY
MMDFGLSNAIKLRKKEGANPIIAEIKVYSPKYGDLLRDRDPIDILKAYERGGAVGISYITEPKHFRGDFKFFRRICRETDLPVLRKDFITSKSEIERTAEAEASAVLIITRILRENTAEFVDYALEHGLETLVEVHSLDEIRIANETKTPLIGINNRDISRLERDNGTVEVTERLCRYVRDGVVKVSESGINSIEDLRRALRCADAALIGTAFMKAKDTEGTVRRFVEARLC